MFSAFIRIHNKPFGPVSFPTLDQAEHWISQLAWHVANLPSLSFTAGEAEDGRYHFSLSFDHDPVSNVYMIPEDQKDNCYAYVQWMLSFDNDSSGINEAHVSEWRKLPDGSVELVDTDGPLANSPANSPANSQEFAE